MVNIKNIKKQAWILEIIDMENIKKQVWILEVIDIEKNNKYYIKKQLDFAGGQLYTKRRCKCRR